jgi:hypothetical protein
VAAYLNVAWGLDLDGLTLSDLDALWAAAVQNNSFDQLHIYLAALNQRYCPL